MKPIQYNFFKSNKEIKEEANDDLQHIWKESVLATVITKIIPKIIIGVILIFLVVSLSYNRWYLAWKVKSWQAPYSFLQKLFLGLKWTVNARLGLIIFLVVMVLLFITLKYGCERFFLLSSKNEEKVNLKEIFKGFSCFLKIVGMEFQRQWVNLIAIVGLYVFLRFFDINKLDFISTMILIVSMLCFVFGFIRSFKTKMVYRIEIDHPEMDGDTVFETSKNLMRNRILSMIILHISFVPFQLLSIFTLFIWDIKLLTLRESADAFFYVDLL